MNKLIIRYLICLVTLFASEFSAQVQATHLMGGSMTYQYMGMVGTDQSYKVTLKIYRYCDATGGGTAALDASMMLGIYLQDPINPNDDKAWYTTETLPLVSSNFITPPSPGVDCSFNTTVCVEEGVFESTILLPPTNGGYHLMAERCCRNGNIVNLSTPGSIGQTYYCFIPPAPVINTSPQFSDIPVPFICTGDTVTIVNNAFDPDGDSLVYSFETPYSGYSSSANPVPDPQIDNNPYGWTIPPVLYNPGYAVGSPFGAGGYSYIDPQTGLTKYYIPNQGFFVVAIEIKEYRNGVLIAKIRRDLQLIAIACPVNAVPTLSNASGAGAVNFVITEGQTLCFPVAFVDANGDSLFLTSTGNIFNGAITNPPASLPNANGDGFVTSQFCWSTDCGQAQGAPYQFIATVTDNGCPPKVTSQIYSIKVNPSPIPPAPAVSINQTPPGAICTGTQVIFTAIPTFGGTNPIYQWQLNGVNVGGNSNTYTSSSLVNGDVITVSLTSNSVCVNNNNAVSPPVVMVVNPFAAPSVSIAAVPAGPICAGTNVTFTATPVNQGATPTYQWTVNGVNVGTNSPTFSSTTLTMASQVSVSLTSDPACPDAVSNVINMVVNPVLTPSVTITSDNAGAICAGQLVTFHAYPTNGGGTPSYQWQINGVNVGTNSNIFTSTTLNNGDNVTVILTTSETCFSVATGVSNVINISVTAPTAPAVSITSAPSGPICSGDNVIFTATPSFGGSTPTYLWYVNGVSTGFTGSIYATSTLTNGASVSVVMNSSLACATNSTATSNIITVTVNPVAAVAAAISISPSFDFCQGTSVTFTAIVSYGGSNPSYQWQVNGVASGTNSSTFTTNLLNDQDKVRCVITSNQPCVSPVTATSNPITVTVYPITNPSVTISSNPSGPICTGTNVVFTATPTLGGTSPVYTWTVNGLPVGNNSATFSSTSLNNGDVVRVSLSSSVLCPVPATVASNAIVMNVLPYLTPAVSITSSPGFPVCDGTAVTFIATPTNGGTNPIYQWKLNGNVQTSTSSSITISSLANGDIINLRMISSETCHFPAAVFSNDIIADITPFVSPIVALYLSPSGSICAGDSLFFTTGTIYAGANPTFNWFVNGINVGASGTSYAGVFNNSDSIQVVLNSNFQCLTTPIDTSNIVVASVLPNLTPAVTINVNPSGPVCPGDLLTFTATPNNGGTTPVYNWTVNGLPVAAIGNVFNSTALNNGDQVRVELTSSEVCVTSATANSNTITVQISPNIVPDISIVVSPPLPACDQDTLTFTATYTGGGGAPAFAWRVNGTTNGSTGSVFVTNQLANNDLVDVVLISSAFCALPTSDTSNKILAIIDPLLTPVAVISANPPGTFCDGKEITYSAVGINGGTVPTYQWLLNGNPIGTNNDTIISSSFLDNDTLQIIYTSNERCLAVNPVMSNMIIIDRLPPLDPLIIAPDEICYGKEVVMEVVSSGGNGGPYYYTWDNGFGTSTSYTFIPGQTTTYTVTVNDSCSTPRTYTKNITVNPLPVPDFVISPAKATIMNPYFEFKDLSINTTSWQWNFGDLSSSTETNPTHNYLNPGYYSVQLLATSDKGCVDSAYKQLYVEDVVTFYLPNSFTPNGDGVNDEFGLVGNAVSGYSLAIYSRWGEQIFVSHDGVEAWNGKDSNGKDVPVGVYVYSLKVFNDPESKIYNGTVSLVK